MSSRLSVAKTARLQRAEDQKAREQAKAAAQRTLDSFVNFQMKMGVGADNPLSTAQYGFNPVTRIRTQLEWVHRGSWLGGLAIDLVAQDMIRAGVEILGDLAPDKIEQIEERNVTLGVWNSIGENVQWARLYGGSIAVMLIDGQRYDTPLNLDTIDKDQFKGLFVFDRWTVEPSLNDLVKTPGPHLGLPKFYTVVGDAPALPRMKIHYSRCIRLEGIRLPYWQRVQENLWGISVLERIWDRMIAFDSATTGAAQLVYKAFLRTYAIEGLRDIVSAGGPPLEGLIKYVETMRKFGSIEGITLLDSKDKMEAMQATSFSGLADALIHFGQQLSGALQIPLVRLFGQSPAGLNSTGESDLRTYYDGINQQQNSQLKVGVTNIYRAQAMSLGIRPPKGFGIKFRPLWQLTEKEKAEIAEITQRTVSAAEESGLISQSIGLKELKQSSRITGIFSNIENEDIEAAEESLPPAGEEAANQEHEQAMALATAKKDDKKDKEKESKRKKAKARDKAIQAVTAMKRLHNMDVIIETEEGTTRRGGKGDHTWEVVLPYDYGYIRQTLAPDGEPVDCMIGPHWDSKIVFVVDQVKLDTGAFDEPKVMFGYRELPDALSAFLQGYSDGKGWQRIAKISTMAMEQFKVLRDTWEHRS